MRFSSVCCNQSLAFNVGHIQLGVASIGARFAGYLSGDPDVDDPGFVDA